MSEFATTLSHIPARVPLRNIAHVVLACTAALAVPRIGIPCSIVSIVILGGTFAWARKHEAFRMFHSTAHTSYGEFFFLAGVCASALLFLDEFLYVWYAAMLTLAFADPLASLIGAQGRHTYHIYNERRTFEGTLTCAVVSTVILAVCHVPLMYAGVGGLLLSGVETISLRGSDNLTLPLLAGLLTLVFATI